jgi:hypothetical protein
MGRLKKPDGIVAAGPQMVYSLRLENTYHANP